MARDHRKLDAFILADKLAVQVYLVTADFPASERFGLRSQIRRAAVSTPTNIVEGCARDSQGDYMRFLDIAFSSCREVIYLLNLATRLGFLDKSELAEVDDLADHAAASLANLRRSLSR
jgi:four helix bundle protein